MITILINFVLLHPEIVTEKVSPRVLTNFFNAIASVEDLESNLPLIQLIAEGSVGPEVATMFTLFINNKLHALITPKDIITNPNWSYVKGQLSSCIGTGNGYRADIASIISTRIINYSLAHAEKHSVSKEMSQRLIELTTDDLIANDLRYYIVKGILNGNKQKFSPLMLNAEVVKMAVR